ncbi:MAG: flagellar biosynthesis protein FlhB [Pseudomonadota bacterium]
MAERDDGQERNEQATPKRRQDARERGQVPRSREWNTLTVLMTGAGGLLLLGADVIYGMRGLMHEGLHIGRAQAFSATAMTETLQQAGLHALGVLAPLFTMLMLAALLAPLLLGGWSFSAKAFSFKWSKLDPIKGLGRLFSSHGAMELVKALVKFVLVGGVTVLWLWHTLHEVLNLGSEPLASALAHAVSLLGWSFLAISAALILIAVADVPFQLWYYARELKMTRQEVKDEGKETEGSPEVKGRIRKLQRDMAQRRMMQEVPKADVIVTNPSHYAVALRYDAQKMRAPKVIAKGADLLALRIRQVGEGAGVRVVSAPVLARAVYFSTELDQEIPAGLYVAVAQLLAYVYQLRQGAAQPMPDFPVPDEFKRN